MKESDEWTIIGKEGGKPIYGHILGYEIKYNCNNWYWQVYFDGQKMDFKSTALYDCYYEIISLVADR